MEIKSNKIDELNIALSIEIKEDDYAEDLKKKLSAYRRKADIKGFRKGMAPAALIQKLYGVQARSEAVNDMLAKSLQDYISDNKLNIIGEPLPSEDKKSIDWENDKDFEFDFDIALSPEIDLEVSKEDSVAYYNVSVDEKAKESMRASLLGQYGSLEDAESIEDDYFFTADFVQGDFKVEDTYVAVRSMTEAGKKGIAGKKIGDVVDVDVNAWFENETDRASMLKLSKEELAGMQPVFRMTVKTIKHFVPAKADQDTFDRIYGKDVVKSEEEFDAKIEERLREEYDRERDYRFMLDVKEYLLAKAAISLPENFMKRWIYYANDGKFTMEDIEKEFDLFLKDYRWQMLRGYFMKKFDVKVSREDLLATAREFAVYQFAMYGINNAPKEQLDKFAENMLSQEREASRIYDKTEDDKCIAAIKEHITLKSEDITIEKLRELNG